MNCSCFDRDRLLATLQYCAQLQVRAAVAAGSIALAAGSTSMLSAKALAFTHLLAYSTWVGTNVWNSFFV